MLVISYAVIAIFILGLIILINGLVKASKDKKNGGMESKDSKNMTIAGGVLTALGACGLIYLWYEHKMGSGAHVYYF